MVNLREVRVQVASVVFEDTRFAGDAELAGRIFAERAAALDRHWRRQRKRNASGSQCWSPRAAAPLGFSGSGLRDRAPGSAGRTRRERPALRQGHGSEAVRQIHAAAGIERV